MNEKRKEEETIQNMRRRTPEQTQESGHKNAHTMTDRKQQDRHIRRRKHREHKIPTGNCTSNENFLIIVGLLGLAYKYTGKYNHQQSIHSEAKKRKTDLQ